MRDDNVILGFIAGLILMIIIGQMINFGIIKRDLNLIKGYTVIEDKTVR